MSGTCGFFKEELKAKVHTMVYTKDREEDEESVGSSNHVTIQNEYDSLPQMRIDEELEDIVSCCHISVNDNITWKRKMLKILHQNLKKE